jgi:hypothetical protein
MTFGFIITRHVNNEKTNQYWNHNIKLIRSHYPNCLIVIIDDNSNINYVKADFNYKNIIVVQSEYAGRGELLPYIYYLKNKWFDNAVIIHDSVFFHKTYNFERLNVKVLPLWFFHNNDSEIDNILKITNVLTNNRVIQNKIINWNKNDWVSCFGSQSYINHDFLMYINNKYTITNLINVIQNRSDRCALERIFGVIFNVETKSKKTMFGYINESHQHAKLCLYSFDEYINSFKKGKIQTHVIKVWTGR